MPASIIAIGGPRGVGKTTAVQIVQERDHGVIAVFISHELDRFCLKETGIDLARLSHDLRQRARHAFGVELAKRLQIASGIVLLDLHYTDARESHDTIIQPDALLRCVDTFAIMTASPRTILERGCKDVSKRRGLSTAEIQAECESESTACARLSERYGRKAYILNTDTTSPEGSATSLQCLIRSLDIAAAKLRAGITEGPSIG